MSFNGKPKSFVTRQGRITSNQRKALDSFWNRFVISNISEIREHIDNQYTLMDIGFGAGETLISIAQKNKEIRLLGASLILALHLILVLKIVLFIYMAIILPHTIMLIKSYLYMTAVGKVTPLRAD